MNKKQLEEYNKEVWVNIDSLWSNWQKQQRFNKFLAKDFDLFKSINLVILLFNLIIFVALLTRW